MYKGHKNIEYISSLFLLNILGEAQFLVIFKLT